MTSATSLLLIAILIALSAFFSLAEISLAASRRLRLRQMADEGDVRALLVLQTQEQPGDWFTVVQVGINAVAILGGIVGEEAFGAGLARLFSPWFEPEVARTLGFVVSFVLVTSLFILFADLLPRRIGMAQPEKLAIRLVRPMRVCVVLFRPLVWFYSRTADILLRMLGLPSQRDDRVTTADILALAEAGTQAGAIAAREQQVIANLFELDTRAVASVMTLRERVAYFLRDDPDEVIRARIAAEPFSTYPVCERDIDHVVGYVDAKDLFQRLLNARSITLADERLVRKVLIVPDRLTLAEVLDQFRQAHEDFAVVVNEYSRVVGAVTLNDVMSTVMGDLLGPADEEQIVRRDDNSWLIDGVAPIEDVLHALQLDELPSADEYETLAGFLMVMLRRVPRRTDSVKFGGYLFEVLDVDSYRIDQVMVTRLPTTQPPPGDESQVLRAGS